MNPSLAGEKSLICAVEELLLESLEVVKETHGVPGEGEAGLVFRMPQTVGKHVP